MYHYRVICEKCQYVERERKDSKFLDAFFLPSRCPKCGHQKDRARFARSSGWTKQFGRYERMAEFDICNPLTWFAGYCWVDFKDS
jgi:ssDNA-binding Zn-finger/Zn-ribbon topoisomerase 1